MRKIAKEKAVRLSERLAKLYGYLKDEAHEEYLAENIMNYGGEIGAAITRLDPDNDEMEYIDDLHHAMLCTVKTVRFLDMVFEKGYLEDRTYISMRRECNDLITILLRKTEKLVPDIDF